VTTSALTASDQPLLERYDGLILDLDGVLQLDDQPVPGAVEVMAKVSATGVPQVFLTNNAARTPAEVAARLAGIGFEAAEGQVLTSAMVAAQLLASRLSARTEVLVVGGPGLIDAVAAVGLCPVTVATEGVAAVVQGWGPDVGWALLAEGSVALRAGAAWVATNADRTLPSPRGPLPGNGSLVAALQTATGLQPEVVGKPQRGMFDVAAARAGQRPLMVGDRLDTDIAGAIAAGLPALLVLTGVASARDLLAAAPAERPTYVGLDLQALLQPHAAPVLSGDRAACGEVTVSSDGVVAGMTHPHSVDDGTKADGLRAAAALAWAELLPETEYDAVLRRLGFD
jgi:glycerol-1-phosphatase